jgi:hypothetical protein
VLDYLHQVQEDIPEHLADFRGGGHSLESSEGEQTALAGLPGASKEEHLTRYKVNLFVDNGETRGAPVVQEYNPTYYNLMGRLDYQARLGTMTTDFRQR